MMNMAYRNILVAVDGSVEAEWAFKKAVNSAKKNNAHLIICHVIDIQALSPSPYAFYTDTRFQDAEKFAEELLTNYSNFKTQRNLLKNF
jgi:nucleotide-binding universal stress UspA family protein